MAGLKNYHTKDLTEAGCDEAGRGCLAGPVVAGSVIFPKNFQLIHHLNDSKQLTYERREQLVEEIQSSAIAYAVAVIDNREIDRINILQASVKAMNAAVDQLNTKPELLLIDGKYFHTQTGIDYECIVKGDGHYASIAAASILAKVYRDQLMEQYHQQYPHYEWITNKGYPTPPHQKAIKKHGPSPLHRQSFNLIKQFKQSEINFE